MEKICTEKVKVVICNHGCSTAVIQRFFKIGYSSAFGIMRELVKEGYLIENNKYPRFELSQPKKEGKE